MLKFHSQLSVFGGGCVSLRMKFIFPGGHSRKLTIKEQSVNSATAGQYIFHTHLYGVSSESTFRWHPFYIKQMKKNMPRKKKKKTRASWCPRANDSRMQHLEPSSIITVSTKCTLEWGLRDNYSCQQKRITQVTAVILLNRNGLPGIILHLEKIHQMLGVNTIKWKWKTENL